MLTQTEREFINIFSGGKGASPDREARLGELLASMPDEQLEESARLLEEQRKLLEDPDDPYWLTLLEAKKLLQNEANMRKLKRYGLLSAESGREPMTGAELASMLKSNVRFKSTDSIKCPELKLPQEDMAWWQDAKLGMFIHWGVYSVIGRGEWAMHNERIPPEEYRRMGMEFNPRGFAADRWAKLAREAGMKYMVMVTRHHDGFAMWDSAASHEGFTSMQAAAGCDFVKQYTEAARREGMKAGLYYSPMDWRFPGYFQPVEQHGSALAMKEQLYGQIRELLTGYGPIDILWYDGSWLAHRGSDAGGAWLWEPLKLNRMVRSLQPRVVMNERSGWEGDFYCDEGPHKASGGIIPFPWEKCFSIAGSWSWKPDSRVMSLEKVLELMVNVFVRNGNVLLNIAPDKNGTVPPEQAELLTQIGSWMERSKEAVYGTRGGPFQPVDGVYGATCRDNEIYVHIFDLPEFRRRKLPALEGRIVSCTSLDGLPVPFTQDEGGISLQVPERCHDPVDTIIKLVQST